MHPFRRRHKRDTPCPRQRWLPVLGAACLLTTLITRSPAAADDWPLVRGDVQGTGVAKSELPRRPEVVWKKKLGESAIEATAVVAGGVVYLGDVDGGFYALNLEDGQVRWKKNFEAGFLAGAAVAHGRVYVGDYDGVFRCLDAETGKQLWEFTAQAEFNAAPIVVDQTILLTSEDGTLYCLDALSGDKRWDFPTGAPLRGSPTVAENRAVLVGCDAILHVIDVSTGKETAATPTEDQTGATPAFFDGRVYIGTGQGTFRCFQLAPPEGAWTYRDPRRGQPIYSAAAVDKDIVVYGSQGKHVYALHPQSGELIWKLPLRSGIDSSPVIVGNRVFIATGRGRLYALDKATGAERFAYDAGGGFVASPAVASSRLVLGNVDGTLYCFGDRLKTSSHDDAQ